MSIVYQWHKKAKMAGAEENENHLQVVEESQGSMDNQQSNGQVVTTDDPDAQPRDVSIFHLYKSPKIFDHHLINHLTN